jgi:hypothetical protein
MAPRELETMRVVSGRDSPREHTETMKVRSRERVVCGPGDPASLCVEAQAGNQWQAAPTRDSILQSVIQMGAEIQRDGNNEHPMALLFGLSSWAFEVVSLQTTSSTTDSARKRRGVHVATILGGA